MAVLFPGCAQWNPRLEFPERDRCSGEAIYDYPNNQSARLLWYHDHAYGITRTERLCGTGNGILITEDEYGRLVGPTNTIPTR